MRFRPWILIVLVSYTITAGSNSPVVFCRHKDSFGYSCKVTIEVVADSKSALETTWEVTSGDGPDSPFHGRYPGADTIESCYFAIGEQLTFQAKDTGSDGICCTHGQGSISVSLNDQMIQEFSDFGSHSNELTFRCVHKQDTRTPSGSPSVIPTSTLVPVVSTSPSQFPTIYPSPVITRTPSNGKISSSPTASASTQAPSSSPSVVSSTEPTTDVDKLSAPTASPTTNLATLPTVPPSSVPSVLPTEFPSMGSSLSPSVDTIRAPTPTPNTAPSVPPTFYVSEAPTIAPSTQPSKAPTRSPSTSPTLTPTGSPSSPPTVSPSISPTVSPTTSPSMSPTQSPTAAPTFWPTPMPTMQPSALPSSEPTYSPTPFQFGLNDTLGGDDKQESLIGMDVPGWWSLVPAVVYMGISTYSGAKFVKTDRSNVIRSLAYVLITSRAFAGACLCTLVSLSDWVSDFSSSPAEDFKLALLLLMFVLNAVTHCLIPLGFHELGMTRWVHFSEVCNTPIRIPRILSFLSTALLALVALLGWFVITRPYNGIFVTFLVYSIPCLLLVHVLSTVYVSGLLLDAVELDRSVDDSIDPYISKVRVSSATRVYWYSLVAAIFQITSLAIWTVSTAAVANPPLNHWTIILVLAFEALILCCHIIVFMPADGIAVALHLIQGKEPPAHAA